MLINKIKNLNNNEKVHILTILKKHSIEYTKNYNGYFFNLDKLDENVINKLNQCIDLIEKNRDIIYILDRKRDEHLKYYKTLIETKLNETISTKINNYIKKLSIKSDESFKPFIKKKHKHVSKKLSEYYKTSDPDKLIKEFNAHQKYDKNTVYYRLYQTCKILSRKAKININNHSENINYNESDLYDNGEDYEVNNYEDEELDDSGETGDIEELDNTEYNDDLLITDDTDNNKTDLKDTNIETVTEDADIIEYETTSEINNEQNISEDDDNDVQEDIDEANMDNDETDDDDDTLKIEFYKNLLKIKHGFDFDYDKDVVMSYEEYIY